MRKQRTFFGNDVTIDLVYRTEGGGGEGRAARARILRNGREQTSLTLADESAALEAAWEWCCLNRQVSIERTGDLVDAVIKYKAGDGWPIEVWRGPLAWGKEAEQPAANSGPRRPAKRESKRKRK